jgi:hypothetical protein
MWIHIGNCVDINFVNSFYSSSFYWIDTAMWILKIKTFNFVFKSLSRYWNLLIDNITLELFLSNVNARDDLSQSRGYLMNSFKPLYVMRVINLMQAMLPVPYVISFPSSVSWIVCSQIIMSSVCMSYMLLYVWRCQFFPMFVIMVVPRV